LSWIARSAREENNMIAEGVLTTEGMAESNRGQRHDMHYSKNEYP
jgi:hypothetical protein